MPDEGEVVGTAEGGVPPPARRAQPRWRRVLFGIEAPETARPEKGGKSTETTKRERPGAVAIVASAITAVLAFGGVGMGSYISSSDNDRTIQAERDRIIEQFRLEQRKARYDEIRQQMTRLENAGDSSKTALLAGVGLSFATSGIIQAPPQNNVSLTDMQDAARRQAIKDGLGGAAQTGAAPSAALADYFAGLDSYAHGLGAVRSTWQDAYTGLDQAISNAEIASSDVVINIARALRDKHRDAYYRAILENIDVVVAKYPDPKPDKARLADALVGVPAETAPPTYDVALLDKSTDELTVMYVRAAKDDLELDDR